MKDVILGLRLPVFLVCLATGLAYGVLTRLVFGFSALEHLFEIMSVSFIFFVPVAVGFITIYFSPREEEAAWARWIALPWAASLLTIGAALILAWEGLICAVVWVPLFLAMSSVGGIIAGLVRRAVRSPASRGLVLASVVLLPFVLSPVERATRPPVAYREVETQVVIHSSADVIWAHIREVRAIGEEELGRSFAHLLGFPKPIEAALSGEGVGAVRHATFEGDVLFVETITDWEPGRRLSFTIAADAGIPAATFDRHVVVGGAYFDVLAGSYRIEALGPERCVLHLSSRQRLSTRFNRYTQVWTDLFMKDIQHTILQVIKRRCEEE
jgi:hypothetical protein